MPSADFETGRLPIFKLLVTSFKYFIFPNFHYLFIFLKKWYNNNNNNFLIFHIQLLIHTPSSSSSHLPPSLSLSLSSAIERILQIQFVFFIFSQCSSLSLSKIIATDSESYSPGRSNQLFLCSAIDSLCFSLVFYLPLGYFFVSFPSSSPLSDLITGFTGSFRHFQSSSDSTPFFFCPTLFQ